MPWEFDKWKVAEFLPKTVHYDFSYCVKLICHVSTKLDPLYMGYTIINEKMGKRQFTSTYERKNLSYDNFFDPCADKVSKCYQKIF